MTRGLRRGLHGMPQGTGRTREATEHLTRAAEIISEIDAADLSPGQA